MTNNYDGVRCPKRNNRSNTPLHLLTTMAMHPLALSTGRLPFVPFAFRLTSASIARLKSCIAQSQPRFAAQLWRPGSRLLAL